MTNTRSTILSRSPDSSTPKFGFALLKTLLTAFLICFVGGCSDTASQEAKRLEKISPESQFEWVMQKLKRAVLQYSPTQASGLTISDRKLTEKLIPPSEGVDHYRATITISYEATYLPEAIPGIFDKEKRREESREKMRRAETYAGLRDDEQSPDPLTESFRSRMEDVAAASRKPTRQPPILETPTMKESKVYELAFLDGKWELQTELEEDSSEQLWFDYALGKDLSK